MNIEETKITITNNVHTHHFVISKAFKKFALYTLLVTVVILVASFSFNYYQLNKRQSQLVVVSDDLQSLQGIHENTLKTLNQLHQKSNKNQRHLKAENSNLQDIILAQQVREKKITEQLIAIEGLLKQEPTSRTLAVFNRLELAQQEIQIRKTLLASIPNGFPLKNKKIITSHYGWRANPFHKSSRKFHKGADFRAKKGTLVYATANGVISFAGMSYGGYGKMILVIHPFGFSTRFAHLSKIVVKKNQLVYKGDLIGETGNSGSSTAPHLHYEIEYGKKTVDPKAFLKWNLYNYGSIFKKTTKIPWESLQNLIKLHHLPALRASLQKETNFKAN